jgi:hypothetical protein
VAAGELAIEVLQQADARVAAGIGTGGIAREFDEVEPVVDRDRA